METTTSIKPMNISELLPGLRGILSKDAMQTLTVQKKPHRTILQTRTNEKVMKPLTMAEMSSVIQGLNMQSSRRSAQTTSARKRAWNSSVKVENKKISHTANGQLKNNPVRKVLNMALNPKIPSTSSMTMSLETPKFPKPESKGKKSFFLKAQTNVRISGICAIPDTPVTNKPVKTRMTLANKENIQKNQPQVKINKQIASPKVFALKKLITPIPVTLELNETWKSSCDDSFLQKEKEIQDIEEKTNAICEEQPLKDTAEVPLPISTPSKDYRNVKDYFNNSSGFNNSSLYEDNTIMCFDEQSPSKENKREESVIVSLCDLLNKATVTTPRNETTELNDLLEVKKQTEHNLKMIKNAIQNLNNIKNSQIKSLESVTKLIQDKMNGQTMCKVNVNKTLVEDTKDISRNVKTQDINEIKSQILSKTCSVIKTSSNSPSYKIPKKHLNLRKSIISKSMPSVSNLPLSPNTDMNKKALSMYMKMKEHMNFLNTPLKKEKKTIVPETPSVAVTSHNLQKQLDKLYN